MKKKLILILICFLALAVFCVIRDFVIKSVVTVAASSVTGAPVHIGGFSLSIIKQSVRISDFKMYNPKGFPRDVLVDIPRIGVTCNIGALFGGKIHLRHLDIDLKELGLAKNKQGQLNVDSLKIAGDRKKAEGKDGKKPAKEMAIQIDTVNLSMGRVVNKDYSVEGPPVIKVYDINLKKTYKSITSGQQLAALIIAEPLKAAGIQGLSVYGASMLTGVAALPVAAAFTLAGKDYAQADYNVSWDRAYEAGLKALKESGRIKKENKATGAISADVRGVQVALKLGKISDKTTRVAVSARKYLLPQPEVAAGIMYRISDELK